MASGPSIRVLNVVDCVTRENLAAVPDTSISGSRVVRELTELIAQCGQIGVQWQYITLEGSMRNGYMERFNDRIRDELLNETLFLNLAHARVGITVWVEDYNRERPHSSLCCATPAAFGAELDRQSPASPYGLHYAAHCFNRAHTQQSRRALIPAGGQLGVTSVRASG
jgi:transposase InsO family protein